MRLPEEAVAARVVKWLKMQEWEVYQEVKHRGGMRADIYATKSGMWWLIETKTAFSLNLLAQAWSWVELGSAHWISVAVPQTKTRTDAESAFQDRILHDYGIGLLRIMPNGIVEAVPPRLRRKARPLKVYEEQKDYAPAGNAKGKAYTPWAGTRDLIVETVRSNPGITMTELMKSINHHYRSSSTARTCIARDIQRGIYKGIRAEKTKGKLILNPIVPAPASKDGGETRCDDYERSL